MINVPPIDDLSAKKNGDINIGISQDTIQGAELPAGSVKRGLLKQTGRHDSPIRKQRMSARKIYPILRIKGS